MKTFCTSVILFFCFGLLTASAQAKKTDILAYYTGDGKDIEKYPLKELTHIIYSFCHLKDGELAFDNEADRSSVQRLVDLKKSYPKLKILLSLGGWGGCEACSDAFSTAEGRLRFAKSVKCLNDASKTDGIDLDWEYPAVKGYPGHPYKPEDKGNFTELVRSLRKELGDQQEISFAAGGFQTYLDDAIDWKAVMPLVDRVNIMSYDLVSGYATVTGHHTPLYSTKEDEESADRAVGYLLQLGIPASKLVIGAAFYTRVWKNVSADKNGLYQAGEHTDGYSFRDYDKNLTAEKGWTAHFDQKAKAPYWYNKAEKKYATGDNIKSVKEKAKYVKDKGLGGIMFWELTLDKDRAGLVDAIASEIN